MYLDMRMGVTVNNIFIIHKHVYFLENGHTKVSKGMIQINNMIHIGASMNKPKSIGSHLHSTMIIIIPT